MDEAVLDVYVREVEAQATFALNAISALNSVLARVPDADGSADGDKGAILHQEVFRSIHSFLTHASNLSRLLWPAAPRRRTGEGRDDYRQRCSVNFRMQRGSVLRSTLGLPEHGHPLRSRRMRDHLEHFDERLDAWQATSARRNYLQDNIGPIGSLPGFETSDCMRWYDPGTKKLWFFGEQHDLQTGATAVGLVRRAAQAALAASHDARRVRRLTRRPNKPLQPASDAES